MDLNGLTLDCKVRTLHTIKLGRILYSGHFFTPECLPSLKSIKWNVVVEGR
ncbi:hypothetical protein JVT61DRAFT_10377 [Boletus reticuloceps]|uniref:Uncharacterized protein n=1 Tax=Boletus reticuloceps TaxID=495285 RepID=A0A8I2YXI4_9AGAM|nr:hypothetical protein JVT61DRAFT_10377 [Boletus reticuloceps]